MLSKKVLAIIEREYVTRAKTKGFIIGTILFPLILEKRAFEPKLCY